MSTPSVSTEAEFVANMATAAAAPTLLEGPDERRFIAHFKGTVLSEVSEPYGLKTERPAYVSQDIVLQTTTSLAVYVDRYRTANTLLFADVTRNAILAIVDYHEESGENLDAGDADHCAHRAELVLPYSEEWKDWGTIDGKMMSQKDFARWIEEHPGDIVVPDAATLREACRDLQALRRVSFTEAVRTNSNAESFEYKRENEIHRDGEAIELPTQFQLGIPVYFGEPTTTLMAFLRWDITENGQLTLGIKLSRAEYVRQAVFKQIVDTISESTGCRAVFGTTGRPADKSSL